MTRTYNLSQGVYNISQGALQVIMNGGDYNQPIMQVLSSKKINSGGSEKERYRILLSDGKHTSSFAMLATQINDQIYSGGIPTFSVIKIEKYITSVISITGKGDTRVLLILGMQIIVPGEEIGEKIGFPTPLIDTGSRNLSEGALQVIMNGGDYNQPIMQVLGIKKINSGSSEKERYRILLSDGKHTISFAMLTTQINDQIGSGKIPTFSVIKIEKYITSVISSPGKGDTRVLLILGMQIIVPGEEIGKKIGSPTPLIDTGSRNLSEGAVQVISVPLIDTGSRNLSEGALQVIMNGGDYIQPIMQVLGSKKINPGNSEKESYRILLSDGKHTISFVRLTTQINDQIGSGGIPTFSVIKIEKYFTTVTGNSGKGDTRVLHILGMQIIVPGEEIGEKIGSPTPLIDTGSMNLSEGALEVIMNGGDYTQPIMQVLGSKKIRSGSSEKERYCILLSDGKHTISFAMLTTQINDQIGSDGIPTFSVIKIEKYITSISNPGKDDTRVLLILGMQIIVPGKEIGKKIGSPTSLEDIGSND